jgi:hypothetical protein
MLNHQDNQLNHDKMVMLSEGEYDRSVGNTQSNEGRVEVSR